MKNYLVNSRVYSTMHSLETELDIDTGDNYRFELDYLTAVRVEGENALAFLQGQLSCDTRQVTPQQIQQGVMCNLKGRALAIMDVILWQNQGVMLVLPADLAEATVALLAKAAVFSKVTLKLAANIKLFGFMLQNDAPTQILPSLRYEVIADDSYCFYRIDNQFAIMMVKNDGSADGLDSTKTFKLRGSLAWHWLRLKHHHVEIYPESRGLFLPHRLDLHQLDYLNFEKGCYKGQEIIARMHFRSTIKHSLQHIVVKIPAQQLRSGMGVFDASNKNAIGELIDFAPQDATSSLIVMSILTGFSGEAHIGDVGSFLV